MHRYKERQKRDEKKKTGPRKARQYVTKLQHSYAIRSEAQKGREGTTKTEKKKRPTK